MGRRVALACLTVLAARVTYVHDKTWDNSLFPSATPTKVVYRDRDYLRVVGPTQHEVGAGWSPSGTTMGGGTVYAPGGPLTATVIEVADGRRVVGYELLGGP